jgi:precorrin-6B methylase 2
MTASRVTRVFALLLCAALASPAMPAAAGREQQGQKPYQPEVGQAGKDVVWVPTSEALVEKMLDLAKVTPKDYVIDLGSGDGRTVIAAAKRGARAHGIEYNAEMVELSKKNAAAAGVGDRATFEKADLFETDFSKATVITMFLLPSINTKLRPTLLKLQPGTRIVSNTFTMEDWEADETVTVTEGCTSWCNALLWIVPAQAEGTWQTPEGRLRITQTFQVVSGSVMSGGRTTPIAGKVRGDEITFTAGKRQYMARLNGDSMEGTVNAGGQNQAFKATRTAASTAQK